MAERNARDNGHWTKIDVKKETRDRLQAHKYMYKYPNVDTLIVEWLDSTDKTGANKNLKGRKENKNGRYT